VFWGRQENCATAPGTVQADFFQKSPQKRVLFARIDASPLVTRETRMRRMRCFLWEGETRGSIYGSASTCQGPGDAEPVTGGRCVSSTRLLLFSTRERGPQGARNRQQQTRLGRLIPPPPTHRVVFFGLRPRADPSHRGIASMELGVYGHLHDIVMRGRAGQASCACRRAAGAAVRASAAPSKGRQRSTRRRQSPRRL